MWIQMKWGWRNDVQVAVLDLMTIENSDHENFFFRQSDINYVRGREFRVDYSSLIWLLSISWPYDKFNVNQSYILACLEF